MVSDNFPYVNRRFLSVCMDGLKVMLKPFTVRANDVVSQGFALCPKGNRGFRNQENLCLCRESGIPLYIGSQNPSSTDKDWNPVPGIRNPRHGIQTSRMEPLLEAKGD